MPAKALTELSLSDLWSEVQADVWGDLEAGATRLLKRLLETTLEEEMAAHIGVGWHVRGEARRDRRNGFYRRSLTTSRGTVVGLKVPRSRSGGFRSALFGLYERRHATVDSVVRELFLRGVSTRNVGRAVGPLLGVEVSASTVSRIAKSLGAEVARFHRRSLSDRWRYLVLDGIVLKVKGALGVQRRVVLVAYGIGLDGRRELVAFRLAKSESSSAWESFLAFLYARGLEGRLLELIVTDGAPGLLSALALIYPAVAHQRCWVHKMRNVAAKLPRKIQKECLAGARAIYKAESLEGAVRSFWSWARLWRGVAPRAVACLEADLEELLSFFRCPQALWPKLRTTNAVERAFREVRRRVRPMSCFTNPASCQRIIYGIVAHLNQEWKKHPLKEITQNY